MYNLDMVNVRLVRERSLYSDDEIDTPKAAVNLLSRELADYDREALCIINLNAAGRPININIASIGALDTCIASMKDIFKSCILSNAAGIIMVHNHPSGMLKPSQADIEVMEKLVRCGTVMEIQVVDGIICGQDPGKYYSFVEDGRMERIRVNAGRAAEKGWER